MTKAELQSLLKLEKKEFEKLKKEYERVADLAKTYANVNDKLKQKLTCYETYFETIREEKSIVHCKHCKHDGLNTCPIAYIEKQTLCFGNHDPDFYCAKGEMKEVKK